MNIRVVEMALFRVEDVGAAHHDRLSIQVPVRSAEQRILTEALLTGDVILAPLLSYLQSHHPSIVAEFPKLPWPPE